ncbi:FAD-dependent oxidoreductase [Pusillimonas sp. TS35]|uniref:FAD-dependent oxidoreductase n=1 Tax=Paracandidimonas lactea TaxID=2895524 RepID=UPI00136A7953|nr:FAD-dependent oxidoreductase [Paracandidimonas lactea]MYN13302.1 FAD-dependent oxidoreductase [Pusillimonas sp. TS35]
MSVAPVAIVGTGLAGYTIARELRRLDSQVPISLFTLDEGHFYSKPMLSNGISAGKDAASLLGKVVGNMREQLGVQVHARSVVQSIRPDKHELVVNDAVFSYSKLVLAVGADPVRLSLGGDACDRIVSINNLTDYGQLHAQLNQARRVVILGAGLIGCEFANDLARAGHHITLVEPASWPLNRLLPADIGAQLKAALTSAGVDVRCGASCDSVDSVDTALLVRLSDGCQLQADVVISAVGLRPNVALAQAAGLAVDKGIVADRFLQTSAPDIYALGDCAQVDGALLPYVMPIMQCARALAATLAGNPTAVNYPAMPIVVKTPALPLAIAPPMVNDGQWKTEAVGEGAIRATYLNAKGQPTGFIVGGNMLAEYRKLAPTVPHWLEPLEPGMDNQRAAVQPVLAQ